MSNRWRNFRREVLSERGAICEICLTIRPHPIKDWPPDKMHLHHVRLWELEPELRFERRNVVVCCQPCHYLLEVGNIKPPAEYYQHD